MSVFQPNFLTCLQALRRLNYPLWIKNDYIWFKRHQKEKRQKMIALDTTKSTGPSIKHFRSLCRHLYPFSFKFSCIKAYSPTTAKRVKFYQSLNCSLGYENFSKKFFDHKNDSGKEQLAQSQFGFWKKSLAVIQLETYLQKITKVLKIKI